MSYKLSCSSDPNSSTNSLFFLDIPRTCHSHIFSNNVCCFRYCRKSSQFPSRKKYWFISWRSVHRSTVKCSRPIMVNMSYRGKVKIMRRVNKPVESTYADGWSWSRNCETVQISISIKTTVPVQENKRSYQIKRNFSVHYPLIQSVLKF